MGYSTKKCFVDQVQMNRPLVTLEHCEYDPQYLKTICGDPCREYANMLDHTLLWRSLKVLLTNCVPQKTQFVLFPRCVPHVCVCVWDLWLLTCVVCELVVWTTNIRTFDHMLTILVLLRVCTYPTRLFPSGPCDHFFGPCDHLDCTMWSTLTLSQGGTHVCTRVCLSLWWSVLVLCVLSILRSWWDLE